MNLSKDGILNLIELYEKYPVIWDSKNGDYYNKYKKNDAWSEKL